MPQHHSDPDWKSIAAHISALTCTPFKIASTRPVSGGCIHRAFRIDGGGNRYFVKINEAGYLPMFEAEADGLLTIQASRSLRVPEPLGTGLAGPHAFLLLEWLETGDSCRAGWEKMAQNLAAMHRHEGDSFGWKRDNAIGATPQLNTYESSWAAFWRKHRLAYQLELAYQNGYRAELEQGGERLLENLEDFFSGYSPRPSLLHGDLWSGNCAMDQDGSPYVFDPAVYHGDREADLAMTELFGGFPQEFYDAYREAWPLDPAYSTRKSLYNLYHVLNHANLFGGGYVRQAGSMINRLLSEIK